MSQVREAADERRKEDLTDYDGCNRLGCEALDPEQRRNVVQERKHENASAESQQSGEKPADGTEDHHYADDLGVHLPRPLWIRIRTSIAVAKK